MIRSLFFLSIVFIPLFGMTQSDYYRAALQPGFTYSYQLTTVKNGNITDLLTKMSRNQASLQFVSGTVFVSKKIGINFKGSMGGKIEDGNSKKEKFNNDIRTCYTPEHYVSFNEYGTYSNYGSSYSFSLGAVYRIVSGKWTHQFGFNAGITKLQETGIVYSLKEHGSNSNYSVRLGQNFNGKMALNLEPSFLISYKFKKRIGIYASIAYSMTPFTMIQFEERTDLYSNTTQIMEYSSKILLQMISGGIGLSIDLGKIIE
jgi:hypothetical protein